RDAGRQRRNHAAARQARAERPAVRADVDRGAPDLRLALAQRPQGDVLLPLRIAGAGGRRRVGRRTVTEFLASFWRVESMDLALQSQISPPGCRSTEPKVTGSNPVGRAS